MNSISASATRRALIFHGGWEGHAPERIAGLLAKDLADAGFEVDQVDDLGALEDGDWVASFDLVVPCWTMAPPSPKTTSALSAAVRQGTGLAGCHGGMGDAFRGDLDYEWMVGGHFVGHPHVGPYTVAVIKDDPITEGLPPAFAYESEQYYMLVDPSVEVLADAIYEFDGGCCRMPVAWKKSWGRGRVFYSALGHSPEEFESCPPMRRLLRQGLLWAARPSL